MRNSVRLHFSTTPVRAVRGKIQYNKSFEVEAEKVDNASDAGKIQYNKSFEV